MTIEVRIPDLGDGVTEATIVNWLKEPGEPVSEGETVVEIMTDKVNVEVESPGTGVLVEILHGADEEVRVGAVIGRIEERS